MQYISISKICILVDHGNLDDTFDWWREYKTHDDELLFQIGDKCLNMSAWDIYVYTSWLELYNAIDVYNMRHSNNGINKKS